jgi:hypothetical protein
MVKDRTLARASRALASTLQAGLLVTGLTLTTSIAQAQTAAPNDAQLQSAVTAALAADPQLRGQQVTATVSQGVVTLNGSVADDVQRTAAEQTAAQVAGVRSIDDSIAVGGQAVASADQTTGTATPPPDSSITTAPQGSTSTMPPPPPADSSQQGQYPQQPNSQYPQQQPGPYGPGPYGSGPYAQQRAQYQPQPYTPGVTPEKQNASGPVTLSPGLLINVSTSEPLSTGRLKEGELVQFTAASDLYANGVVAIPRGAVLSGQVVEAKNAGPLGGSPKLDLKLTSVTLGSQTYPLTSDVWSSQGPNKAGYTAANTVGGAAFGALIGAIAGGGVGAGIGAAAGGASGALVSGATHGPRLDLPAEALLQFHLTAPLTVQPVKFDEAERLAATVPQQPVLRTRPGYVVAPYPYYARPYYPYPAYYYYYGRY